MVVPARIPALVLCLAMCEHAFGSHHVAAFTTAASFRTPTFARACRHAAPGVEAQQQRTCRRRARPSSTCRRRHSPSSGSVRLSAVGDEDEEGDDTAGVYVATEVREKAEKLQLHENVCAFKQRRTLLLRPTAPEALIPNRNASKATILPWLPNVFQSSRNGHLCVIDTLLPKTGRKVYRRRSLCTQHILVVF